MEELPYGQLVMWLKCLQQKCSKYVYGKDVCSVNAPNTADFQLSTLFTPTWCGESMHNQSS